MDDEREPRGEGFRFPWEDEQPPTQAVPQRPPVHPTEDQPQATAEQQQPGPQQPGEFTELLGALDDPGTGSTAAGSTWPSSASAAPDDETRVLPPATTPAAPPTATTVAWGTAALTPRTRSAAQSPVDPPPGDAADGDDEHRRRNMLIAIGGTAGLLALAATSLFVGIAVGTPDAPASSTTAPNRPAPDELPAFGLDTCSVNPLASAGPLKSFTGSVVDVRNGDVVFSRDGDAASRPFTTQLVITAMAALDVLGPDYRFTTQVVEGPEDGSIVLVGGGDVTLSNYTNGSVYADAANIVELAQNAKATYYGGSEPDPYDEGYPGERLRTVYVDTSLWSGETSLASWGDSREAGTLPYMEALMVDGDRESFDTVISPRGDDPSASAAESFVAALDLQLADGEQVLVTEGTAPEGANVLATVESQPVSVLVQQMLQLDDYTLAEGLARQVAVQSGGDGSFASVTSTLTSEIETLGVDTSGVSIVDGSGYSSEALVPPAVFGQLLRVLDDDREDPYGPIWTALPIAAQSGVLATRFTGDAAALAGQFAGYAATGSGGSTLVGVMPAADREYAVALYALGNVNDRTPAALDRLAAGIAACGANLTDH